MSQSATNVSNGNYSTVINTSTHETSVQIFQNSKFGEIRTLTQLDGNPYFCLNDVMKSLGLVNITRLKSRLLGKGFTTSKVLTKGGFQDMLFINEPNLYKCIFQSRKAEAEDFQDWVTSEVLPTIRKTGGYIPITEQDSPEVIMAKALQIAQSTINDQKQRVQMLEGENEIQQHQIKKLEPKAKYTDEVLQSTSTFTTTQMADDLGLTARELNKRLKDLGVQYSQSSQWHLTARYKDKGYTDIRIAKFVQNDEIRTKPSLVWTERGRLFLTTLRNSGKI